MKIWTTEEEAARLKARFHNVNRAAFVRDHKLKGGQSMIYQHINALRPIGKDAAIVYAKGFGCSLEEISPRLAKEAIDAASHTGPQSNVEPGPDIRGQVPLISWVAAGDFCESPENFSPDDAEKWLSCPVPHGKYTYCLRVVGKSMDNGDDGYRDGEIIFVDPDAEAMPGKDAIVRTPNGESTFKRLKQDVDGIYLQALNPRWEPNYFKMPEGSTICGIVIFAGRER